MMMNSLLQDGGLPLSQPDQPVDMDALSQLARRALTSPDKSERDGAAQQLLFLSLYDNWNFTRMLLVQAKDNYLRFIVYKAVLFVVRNELGVEERAEMANCVLQLMHRQREQGEDMPRYLKNVLYSIYVSGIFNNWKVALYSLRKGVELGQNNEVDPEQLGAMLVKQLETYLTRDETFDCLLEAITYFSTKIAQLNIIDVALRFACHVLPHFFMVAANALAELPQKAAEVCCVALESVPHVDAPLASACPTTDPSVHLCNWSAWESALSIALHFALRMISENPYSEDTSLYARLVRNCSCVVCHEADFLLPSRQLTGELLEAADKLLALCERDNSLTEMLQLGCILTVNAFERRESMTTSYFVEHPSVIDRWAAATEYILARFTADEEDLRRWLVHLFFLFANKLLPPRETWGDRGEGLGHTLQQTASKRFYGSVTGYSRGGAVMAGVRGAASLDVRGVTDGATGETPSPMGSRNYYRFYPAFGGTVITTDPDGGGGADTAETTMQDNDNDDNNRGGPFDQERTRHIEKLVSAVCMRYFDSVVHKAPLQESSREIRIANSILLHNEKTLMPLSQLLFCDRLNLLPMLVVALQRCINQYQLCVQDRGSKTRSRTLAAALTAASSAPEGGFATADATNESLLSLAMEHMDLMNHVSEADAPLFLTNVCLSQLSVMISILAIAMINGAVSSEDAVLELVADFARQLLSEDDQLTDELLQCLTLNDCTAVGGASPAEQRTGFGARGDGAVKVQGEVMMSDSGSGGVRPRVHLGVLRSLFFFCACMYESELARRQEFYETTLNLLRFVYLFHSDDPTLLMDANTLLYRIVTNGVSGTAFLNSDKLRAIIQAVKADTVTALAFATDPGWCLTSEQAEARSDFLITFTTLVEARFYAGYEVDHVLQSLVRRMLAQERLLAHPRRVLEDMTAVTQGCHQPDTMATILTVLFSNRAALEDAMRRAPAAMPTFVRWLSHLCTLAQDTLERSNCSQAQWQLASLVMNSLCTYFQRLSYPAAPSTVADAGGASLPSASPGVEGGGAGAGGGGRLFRFATDGVEVEVVYYVADILGSMCHHTWCNMGILWFYERNVTELFFLGAVQLFLSTSVQMLMSDVRGSERVLGALLSFMTLNGEVANQMHTIFMRQRLWQSLLAHLTKCLGYSFSSLTLRIIYFIIDNNTRLLKLQPMYWGISDSVLGAAFYECAVLLAVSPGLEMREMHFCIKVLQRCFESAPEVCTHAITSLLNVCSAYHRVRLRTLLTMLREHRQDFMESYLSLFGQLSRVGTLSAW